MSEFPLLPSEPKVEGGLTSLPWRLVEAHEKQALSNHDQSVQELARRGGLSVTEAVAVLEDRKWTRMDFKAADDRLKQLVAAHRQTSGFTLIELMVVIAILALLVSIVIGEEGCGTASGSKMGVVTSVESDGTEWRCEMAQQGTRRVKTGKTSHLEDNMWRFKLPGTPAGNALAAKIQAAQSHVWQVKYHREGMTVTVTGVEDLGVAEQ
jgi:prepilin-type N-terminal cleavage/methylation domain-containing protein